MKSRTPVQADGKRFPDLFLVRPQTRSVLVAELKVPPNTVSAEQAAWLADFEACGVPAFTWAPADWAASLRVSIGFGTLAEPFSIGRRRRIRVTRGAVQAFPQTLRKAYREG